MSIHLSKEPAAIWSVAPKLGIDLSRAIRSNAITPQALSGMLRNCATCWHRRKCASWVHDASALDLPAFCASSAELTAALDRGASLRAAR